jgi:predicted double-glycine peptidase
MVTHHFGGQQTEAEIEAIASISPVLGMTCRAIAEAATVLGYRASVERGITWQRVEDALHAGHPIVALLDPNVLYFGRVGLGHFVVIIGLEHDEVMFHDPALGDTMRASRSRFEAAWVRSGCEGVIVYGTR